jgi:hypothetical protein
LLRINKGWRAVTSRTDEYRRLAQECLVTAREIANEEKRAALIHMAQVWLRLAEEQDAPAANESQPAVQQQQQQQPQPRKDNE